MRAGIDLDLSHTPADLDLEAVEYRVIEDLPALPEGWRWASPWAIANQDQDHVCKLLVDGEAGYLGWLCVGPGQGYRGRDLGEWLPQSWPTAREAMGALAQARRALEARSMSP